MGDGRQDRVGRKGAAQSGNDFTFRFRSKVSICSFVHSRNIFVGTHSVPHIILESGYKVMDKTDKG